MGRKKLKTIPGSVYVRSNKLWIKIKGKRISTGLNNTYEGRQLAEEMKESIWKNMQRDEGLLPQLSDNEMYTVREAQEKFLQAKQTVGRAYQTMKSYRNSIDHIIGGEKDFILDKKIMRGNKIRFYIEDVMQRYIESNLNEKRESTLVTELKIMQRFLKFCYEEGYISKLLTDFRKKYSLEIPKSKVYIYNDEEMNKLIKHAFDNDKEFGYLLLLMRLIGGRIKETSQMMINQLDFERKKIYIPNKIRSNEMDEIPMSTTVENVLQDIIKIAETRGNKREGYLFRWKLKSARGYLLDKLHKYENELGIPRKPGGFHKIRKSFASELINKKVNIYDTQKLIRHRDINLTLALYTKYDMDNLRLASEQVGQGDCALYVPNTEVKIGKNGQE